MDFRKTAITTAVGSLAAGLLAATPAYAYKVNDNLELNATVFANALSVDGNPPSAQDDAASGFHFDRAYFETRYHADENNMVRVTLDQKAPDGSVFVKYAYWQHKFNSDVAMKVGQNHTPLVDYLQTKLWGHRYVQKTYTDFIGAQTSSDIGVSVFGKAGDSFDYYVSLMNGEGYTHTPNGAGYSIAGRAEYHTGGIHVGLFAQSESDHNGVSGYDPERQEIYAWWENDQVRIGGQYLMADDGNASNPFNDGKGFNVLANVKIPTMGSKTAAFVRYDSIDYKDTGNDQTLTIVGVEFEAAPHVMLAPNVQVLDPGTPGSDTVTSIGINGQFKI